MFNNFLYMVKLLVQIMHRICYLDLKVKLNLSFLTPK